MTEAAIEADPTVPVIRITRDFDATPEQLFRAHTDPELFVRWVGPDGMLSSRIDHWDARDRRQLALRRDPRRRASTRSGAASTRSGRTASCRRSPSRGMPDDGGARDAAASRTSAAGAPGCTPPRSCDSFAARDGWLQSGMEVGINEGYAKLDGLLRDRAV